MRKEGETEPLLHEIVTNGDVEVFILAGGKGSKLRNSDKLELQNTPKILVVINTHRGRITMLDNVILGLVEGGFCEITLLTSNDPEAYGDLIESHTLRAYPDLSINFSREDRPLGTAGAVYKAFSNKPGETAIITPSDTLFPFGVLQNVLSEHKKKQSELTWLVTTNPGLNAQNTGRILVNPKNGVIFHALEGEEISVDQVIEQNQHLLPTTSVGVIIANRDFYVSKYEEFLNHHTVNSVVDLYRHFIPWLVLRGETVYSYDIRQPAPDLGTPDRLEQFGWR
uniref:NDP-sugar synthase n=1 Tax=candidate division CPR3 bacterium TaxID=2268181 RepID=A0A7V3J9J1_UNCC3